MLLSLQEKQASLDIAKSDNQHYKHKIDLLEDQLSQALLKVSELQAELTAKKEGELKVESEMDTLRAQCSFQTMDLQSDIVDLKLENQKL